MPQEVDFYDSRFGNAQALSWRNRRLGRWVDPFYDARLHMSRGKRRLGKNIGQSPTFNILLVGIAVPGRETDVRRVTDALACSRHRVEISIVAMGNSGKFDNVNRAISTFNLGDFDWLVVTDDDITTPPGLLDECLQVCWCTDFRIFQPAHRFHSFCTFKVNQRHWNTLARETRFVESGPLTGFHRSTFEELLPFPSLRWAWGLDVYWSDLAQRRNWKIGVVDSIPIRHLRRIGRSYGQVTAIEQARTFLKSHDIVPDRRNFLRTVQKFYDVDLPLNGHRPEV